MANMSQTLLSGVELGERMKGRVLAEARGDTGYADLTCLLQPMCMPQAYPAPLSHNTQAGRQNDR